VTVTAVVNLAVKVADIDAGVAWFRAIGASATDPVEWRGALRSDVSLGALQLTLFTRAIYEEEVDLPAEGFLHVAMMSDDLEADTARLTPFWGPQVVEGSFGVRRIVFVEAPGQCRLEFMEQLDGEP
jgi:hypothetical protein